jgi:electron transfer flavoprotein alpha subunit
MIFVVVEHSNNQIKSSTDGLLVFAQRIGRDFVQPVTAVVLAEHGNALAEQLRSRKIDHVLVVENAAFADHNPDATVHALREILQTRPAFMVVAAQSAEGLDFMPRLSVALRRPFIAGCTGYDKQGENLLLTRQVFNARMNLTTSPRGAPPCLVTLAQGAFPAEEVETGGNVELESMALDFSGLSGRRRLEARSETPKGQADLASAQIIVAGGRGLKQKENFQLVFDLAKAVGGSVGASRPVVDAEWLPREYQIGSSGQTVSPRLYLALGISGAVQHLVGMQGSRCIVAINKDPEAPIFKVAHYGIVDDLFKVVPALTQIFRDLKLKSPV